MKTILYASDIEEGARPAFRTALSMCCHDQSRIVFLHVIEAMHSNARNLLGNILDHDELEELTNKAVENVRQKVTKRVDLFFDSEFKDEPRIDRERIEFRIADGVVWQKIIKVADEINADVIVMGTRRKHKLSMLKIGSTAHKVLEHANRPVLIVPL
jgi:nucleotide-binding universal stress UspA family protein